MLELIFAIVMEKHYVTYTCNEVCKIMLTMAAHKICGNYKEVHCLC